MIQLMACLMNCKETAKKVNVINTGSREDVYQSITDTMTAHTGQKYSRSVLKPVVMTVFYGSTQQPKNVFGEDTPELEDFYSTLATELPGAMECLQDIQSCWQPDTLAHIWTLPDGHIAHVKVEEAVDKKIEIDELDHATFTHRIYVNQASEYGLSLAAR